MNVPKTPDASDFTKAAEELAAVRSSCSIAANIEALARDSRLMPLERAKWRSARQVVRRAACLLVDASALAAEIARLKAWVADLQAGQFVNCVYCGHRYGPSGEVPVSMADVLKEHIQTCPEHPMSALKAEVVRLETENAALRETAADAKWSLQV